MTKWQLYIGRLRTDGTVMDVRAFTPEGAHVMSEDLDLSNLLDEGWEPVGFAVGRSSVIMLRKPWRAPSGNSGIDDAWKH